MTSVRRSIAINGIAQAISFILTLTSMVIVARLLSPSEIGIFSVSVSLIAFGHVFRDFGIGQYLVQASEVSRDHLRAANTIMIGISWSIALIFFMARYPAAEFYQNESIAEILTILACNFFILPFGAPLLSMLRREMKFGHIAIVGISATFVQSLTTISLALNGFSYMSMAWGSLAGTIATTIILISMRPSDVLIVPKLSGIQEILRFGFKSTATSLVGQAGSSAPDLIIGRTLGFAEVAFYSRAWGLMSLVMLDFANIVRGVFFPAFARSMREGADPASTYSLASTQLTGLTIPMLVMLALLSDPLIHLLFGPQWGRSAPLASLICLYAILTAPFSLAGAAMIAYGKINIFMHAQFLIQGARILAIMTSFYFDLEQVVLVLGIAYCIEAYVYTAAMRKSIGLTFSMFSRSIWRSYVVALATVIIPASLGFVLFVTETNLGDLFFTLIATIIAALCWLTSIYLLHHPLMPEIERIRINLFQRYS